MQLFQQSRQVNLILQRSVRTAHTESNREGCVTEELTVPNICVHDDVNTATSSSRTESSLSPDYETYISCNFRVKHQAQKWVGGGWRVVGAWEVRAVV